MRVTKPHPMLTSTLGQWPYNIKIIETSYYVNGGMEI